MASLSKLPRTFSSSIYKVELCINVWLIVKGMIDRIAGCNHMHCPCGAHFCFQCGGKN